jgi:hypothetical protein
MTGRGPSRRRAWSWLASWRITRIEGLALSVEQIIGASQTLAAGQGDASSIAE